MGKIGKILVVPGVQSRPYQERIISKTLNFIDKDGVKSILINSPTGSGKTVIGLSIALQLQQQYGYSIGWSAMRRELLNQACLENTSKGFNIQNLVPISMFAKNPEHVDVLIVDEAQHDATESMGTIHGKVKPKIVIGLSATPWRSDRASLCFEKQIQDAGIGTLIRDGYLAPFHHYNLEEYTAASVSRAILDCPTKWGKSVVFFREQRDCARVVHELRSNGVTAELVTADSDREVQLAAFRAGEVQVLVNMMILTEGFDESSMQTVFVRPSTKGPSLQMAGRVFRQHPNFTFKQVVQCQQTKYPVVRAARAAESYMQQGDQWLSIATNKNIEKMAQDSIQLIVNTQVSFDKSKIRNFRDKKRFKVD